MSVEPDDKPRGLWSVMRKGASTAEAPVEEDPHRLPVQEEESPIPQEPAESGERSTGKGLWALMGLRSPAVSAEAPRSEPSAEEVPASPPSWFRGKVETDEAAEETKAPPAKEPAAIPRESPAPPPKARPRNVPQTQPGPIIQAVVETPAQEKLASLTKKTGRSRGAMWSFLVGLLALPMTLWAMQPEIWTRIPAALVGFGALVVGLLAFNEIQHSRGQQTGKGLAILGMLFGTVSMFLGPLVIAPWSENRALRNTRNITKDHLEAIGAALKTYHSRNDQYPPGGTYRVEETGETTPMHSWMTHLLPYLDANDVYRQIRFDDPWDEPMNKPPFSRKIPAFLAGSVPRTHSRGGYGVSHFAGVGGQVEMAEGQFVNAGIFERGSNVRQSDVNDGLSQTLVAGEIADGYRPWGEPGNWRTVGEGLNRDSTSFGNADGTGAMFLKADGSVQFFANSVSPDVLRRLSTRDGEDNRMIPQKFR